MSDPTDRSPYAGAAIALLTQHGKARSIEPELHAAVGASLRVVDDFDTDTLGTFTRDIPRAGTQLEAARRKAHLAVERSGLPFGVGSEGSFAPDPFGIGTWNLELLVFVDTRLGIEVVGRSGEPGLHHHAFVTTLEEAFEFAGRAGFPAHGLVLRPDRDDHPRPIKGVDSPHALAAAFAEVQRISESGRVFLEHDLRAHQHPTRMANIGRAARDLAERLCTRCPACTSPGWGFSRRVPGLPCAACGLATSEALADAFACVKCGHEVQRPRGDVAFADPGRCDFCNP